MTRTSKIAKKKYIILRVHHNLLTKRETKNIISQRVKSKKNLSWVQKKMKWKSKHWQKDLLCHRILLTQGTREGGKLEEPRITETLEITTTSTRMIPQKTMITLRSYHLTISRKIHFWLINSTQGISLTFLAQIVHQRWYRCRRTTLKTIIHPTMI